MDKSGEAASGENGKREDDGTRAGQGDGSEAAPKQSESPDKDAKFPIIRTSDADWIKKLAAAYAERKRTRIIDDAKIGIDPARQTILEMGRNAGLSFAQWSAVLVSLGVGVVGIGMVAAAIFDPEPTTKLGLLVAGGITCVVTGGGSALYILGGIRPPYIKVKITPTGVEFELRWDFPPHPG